MVVCSFVFFFFLVSRFFVIMCSKHHRKSVKKLSLRLIIEMKQEMLHNMKVIECLHGRESKILVHMT